MVRNVGVEPTLAEFQSAVQTRYTYSSLVVPMLRFELRLKASQTFVLPITPHREQYVDVLINEHIEQLNMLMVDHTRFELVYAD